jgi:hypothetical protein
MANSSLGLVPLTVQHGYYLQVFLLVLLSMGVHPSLDHSFSAVASARAVVTQKKKQIGIKDTQEGNGRQPAGQVEGEQ